MQLPAYTDISGPVPQSVVPAFGLIDAELSRVKKLVTEQIADSAGTPGLSPLVGYINRRSGKMLRPGVLLLAGAACGEITDRHIHVAAIIEMVHNATLLHDDVMDEGQKRRGAPTVNSLWGNESAVLLGDFLLSKVFRMCADLEPQVIEIIADTTARTCEGELRQIAQRQNWQLTESEYIDIITEKSAAFFSCCCRLGAFLAGAGQTRIGMLADFGRNVGIAFQITDDLLDITGQETRTGKTPGSDVNKSKLTLPVIHLLTTADDSEKNGLIKKLNTGQVSRKSLLEMLTHSGSLEYARGRAQQFVAKAIQTLGDLKQSDAKSVLIAAAKFAAERTT